jgi:protein suppressor of PHYA-105 1
LYQVFGYHKSLPMPLGSHKFGCIDRLSGRAAAEETGKFVSSVCWRAKSKTLVAANSVGNIKVLEMV